MSIRDEVLLIQQHRKHVQHVHAEIALLRACWDMLDQLDWIADDRGLPTKLHAPREDLRRAVANYEAAS